MATPNPCDVVNSILEYENQLLSAVMAKFDSLERLIQLIYEAGESLLNFIPNPLDWIPVAVIDLSLYERLRSSCPMLKLPPVSTQALDDLRAEVEKAYLGFFSNIYSNHPWSNIEHYRAMANKYLNDLYDALGRDWLACASAACYVVSEVASGEAVQLNDRFKALVTGDFDWLASEQRSAYQDFRAKRDGVSELFQSESSRESWNEFFPKQVTGQAPVIDPRVPQVLV